MSSLKDMLLNGDEQSWTRCSRTQPVQPSVVSVSKLEPVQISNPSTHKNINLPNVSKRKKTTNIKKTCVTFLSRCKSQHYVVVTLVPLVTFGWFNRLCNKHKRDTSSQRSTERPPERTKSDLKPICFRNRTHFHSLDRAHYTNKAVQHVFLSSCCFSLESTTRQLQRAPARFKISALFFTSE